MFKDWTIKNYLWAAFAAFAAIGLYFGLGQELIDLVKGVLTTITGSAPVAPPV